MSQKCSSENCQKHLVSQIQAAKFEKSIKEHKHESLFDGLDSLDAEINRFVLQLPADFNTDRHKLNLLREAVINYHSVDDTVLKAQAQKLTFHSLLTH